MLAKYNQRVDAVNSLLCVGLDSVFARIPDSYKQGMFPQFAFNRWIIDQTHRVVSAYKPNIAFYEARGEDGMRELKMTMDYLHERHPEIFTICDAKRGDIDSSSMGYAEAIFDWLGFDAVTLNPYMGQDALKPFLERRDKCSIILCRTSNKGAQDIQDLHVGKQRLWEVIAEKVANEWNTNENCMLVMGATYPAELKRARALVGDMTLLIPGIGTQGGSIQAVMESGLNQHGQGLIINASRSILFGADPTKEAKRLREEINQHRAPNLL